MLCTDCRDEPVNAGGIFCPECQPTNLRAAVLPGGFVLLDEIDCQPARTSVALTVEALQALLEAANIVLGLPSYERGFKSYDDAYDELRDARDVLRLAA